MITDHIWRFIRLVVGHGIVEAVFGNDDAKPASGLGETSPLKKMLASFLSRAENAEFFKRAMSAYANNTTNVPLSSERLLMVLEGIRGLVDWKQAQIAATFYQVVGGDKPTELHALYRTMLDAVTKGADKKDDGKGTKTSKAKPPDIGGIVQQMLGLLASDGVTGQNDSVRTGFIFLAERMDNGNIQELCEGLQLCDETHPAQQAFDLANTALDEVAGHTIGPLIPQLRRMRRRFSVVVGRYEDAAPVRQEAIRVSVQRGANAVYWIAGIFVLFMFGLDVVLECILWIFSTVKK